MTDALPYRRKEVIGDCTLYLGDCRDILPTIGKVDAVVTDPPYGIEYSKGTNNLVRKKAFYSGAFADTRANVESVVVPSVVASLRLSGGRGVITPGAPCAWLYPEPSVLGGFYQPATVGYNRWGRANLNPILFYGKDPMAGKDIQPTVIPLNAPPSTDQHPCAKPMPAALFMVKRASVAGESLLDPFMGSGTTGVACAKLGRKFIGIEIDETYFNIACDRIRKAYAQPDFFVAPPAPKPKQEAML